MEIFASSVETTSCWVIRNKVYMGSYKVRNFFKTITKVVNDSNYCTIIDNY